MESESDGVIGFGFVKSVCNQVIGFGIVKLLILLPQHCNHHDHHDEVHKNVILNTMGMTQSKAYCLNHLLNRETVMVIKMTCNVGIEKK